VEICQEVPHEQIWTHYRRRCSSSQEELASVVFLFENPETNQGIITIMQNSLLNFGIFLITRRGKVEMGDIVDKILDIFDRAISAEVEEKQCARSRIMEKYKTKVLEVFDGSFTQKSVVRDIIKVMRPAIHHEALSWAETGPKARMLTTRLQEKYEKELTEIHEGALEASYATALHMLFREEDKL